LDPGTEPSCRCGKLRWDSESAASVRGSPAAVISGANIRDRSGYSEDPAGDGNHRVITIVKDTPVQDQTRTAADPWKVADQAGSRLEANIRVGIEREGIPGKRGQTAGSWIARSGIPRVVAEGGRIGRLGVGVPGDRSNRGARAGVRAGAVISLPDGSRPGGTGALRGLGDQVGSGMTRLGQAQQACKTSDR